MLRRLLVVLALLACLVGAPLAAKELQTGDA